MMTEHSPKLPDFDDPPLQETILSVVFDRMVEWKIAHYGAFGVTVRSDYPLVDTLPPLPPVPQNPSGPATVRISPADINLARACFINNSGSMQIQLQNDRFLSTWARATPSDTYPRYSVIRPNFERQWNRFIEFLASQRLPKPSPRQCEITYSNHIGSVPQADWSMFQSPEKIFAPWSGKQTNNFLPKPSMVSVLAQYAFGHEGELTVALQPVIRVSDQAKLVQLNLTARLPLPKNADTQTILSRFDVGREWIVRGFADITTSEMQSIWKRKD